MIKEAWQNKSIGEAVVKKYKLTFADHEDLFSGEANLNPCYDGASLMPTSSLS